MHTHIHSTHSIYICICISRQCTKISLKSSKSVLQAAHVHMPGHRSPTHMHTRHTRYTFIHYTHVPTAQAQPNHGTVRCRLYMLMCLVITGMQPYYEIDLHAPFSVAFSSVSQEQHLHTTHYICVLSHIIHICVCDLCASFRVAFPSLFIVRACLS